MSNVPLLDAEAVLAAVAPQFAAAWSVHVVEQTRSTNDAVLALPMRSPCVALFAEKQTHGRGRRGNVWFGGAPGENLILSCAYACPWPLAQWSRLTHVVALAVKRVLDALPLARPLVKWPNDIFLGQGKVAGILIETKVAAGAQAPLAVLGIGINVNGTRDTMPEQIVANATSIRELTGMLVDRAVLAGALLSEISAALVEAETQFATQLDELRHASYLSGKRIRARTAKGTLEGLAQGLGDEGQLLIHLDDGSVEALTSAEEVRLV